MCSPCSTVYGRSGTRSATARRRASAVQRRSAARFATESAHAGYWLGMETEQDHTQDSDDRPDEGTAALDTDNPDLPDDALTEGSEPGAGDDIRDAERP